jgi:hypothetical protein
MLSILLYQVNRNCLGQVCSAQPLLLGVLFCSTSILILLLHHVSCVPCCTLIGAVPGSCIRDLGWNIASFIMHYNFTALYLVVSLQFERVLCLWFNGDHIKFNKPFSSFDILNCLFSSTIMPISIFSVGMQWLYFTPVREHIWFMYFEDAHTSLQTTPPNANYPFWANPGAMLTQLHLGEPVGGNPCPTALMCLISDSNATAKHTLGEFLWQHH